jgi:hypothetical protein
MLPFDCETTKDNMEGWEGRYSYPNKAKWEIFHANTEVDARAKMLIYVLGNKLLGQS